MGGKGLGYGTENLDSLGREGIHSVSRKESGNKNLNLNLNLKNQEKKTNRNNDMGKIITHKMWVP